MTIEMVPIEEFVRIPGIYKHLVRADTLMGKQYMQARVHISKDLKLSIDVSNQRVTHISIEPLYFD